MKFLSGPATKASTRLLASLLLVGFLLGFGLGAPQTAQAAGLVDNALEDILDWLLNPVAKTLSAFSNALLPQEVRVPFVFSGALPLFRVQDVICNYIAFAANCDPAGVPNPGTDYLVDSNYVTNPTRNYVSAPIIRGGLAALLSGAEGPAAAALLIPEGDQALREEIVARSNPDPGVGSTRDSKVKALPFQADKSIKEQRQALARAGGALEELHIVSSAAEGLLLGVPQVAPHLYDVVNYDPVKGVSLKEDQLPDPKTHPVEYMSAYLALAGGQVTDQVHRMDIVNSAIVAERNELNRIAENAGNVHSGGLSQNFGALATGDIRTSNPGNPDSINAHLVRASETGGATTAGTSDQAAGLIDFQSRGVTGLTLSPDVYAAGLKAALRVASRQ